MSLEKAGEKSSGQLPILNALNVGVFCRGDALLLFPQLRQTFVKWIHILCFQTPLEPKENLSFNVIRKIKGNKYSSSKKHLHMMVTTPFKLLISTYWQVFVQELQKNYVEPRQPKLSCWVFCF